MKIGSIKIKNFRSILETDFNLSDGVTAFAGGNESGKSNILLAIDKFLKKEKFSISDRYQLTDGDPIITVSFTSFTSTESETLQNFFGIKNIKSLTISRSGQDY